MPVVSTGLNTRGLRSEFFDKFSATQSHFEQLSTRIPSDGDSEAYRWLGQLPRMREWGTGRLAKGLNVESYSVENEKYEATIEVDRDEIADDQTGQILVRIGEMGVRAATHKDYLIAQLMINGASSGFNSYDGVTFFNAAHVSGDSGSQDNDLGYTAAAATKTTDECRGAIRAATAAMMAFLDDQGQPMVIDPSGLAIVCPPSMYWTMLEAVDAAFISNTSNVTKGIAKVISFPWLTTGTTWYLCKTNGVMRPFIFQDREPLEFNGLTENSDEGFRREKFLYGVRARYAMTYGYWQYCVRTVFTN